MSLDDLQRYMKVIAVNNSLDAGRVYGMLYKSRGSEMEVILLSYPGNPLRLYPVIVREKNSENTKAFSKDISDTLALQCLKDCFSSLDIGKDDCINVSADDRTINKMIFGA